MIEVKITVPNEEIGEGQAALSRRLAVLGYTNDKPHWSKAEVAVTVTPASPEPPVASNPAPAAPVEAEAPKRRGRPPKSEPAPAPAPNITATPEHRVEPEVEAQDEADEAAEVEVSVEYAAEDLRAAMGSYSQKFGMDAALADGPHIFNTALGQPPEGGWRLSVAAAMGGETLSKSIAAWREAAAAGARFGGEA